MTQGRQPVRIIDVAALAGVSASTVSKALNNTGALHDSTRERVRAAAEKLGFVPDTRGRALSSRRSFAVGLLSTDSAGRFSLPVVLGAESALAVGEISALLATARHDPVREQHHVRTLVARHVDGIIVTGRTTDPREPIRVAVPVVYAFAPSSDPDDACVVPDDADGVRQVIAHLHSLGHRRVAHVGGRPDQRTSHIRRDAVIRALDDTGMELVGEPLFGEWSERWGRHAVDILLSSHRPDEPLPVDAIVFASDQLARGGCDRLRERGLRVPADIAVTGYDNWEVMALASRPPLTTVDMRLEELGQRAGELLLNAIAGRPSHGTEMVAPRLITRESTLGTD
ncbi:LacI family DNA-binding transcriptional regulator [Phytoactinopolyspora endophytica]|uniref:LacI family DNA-binding transcriptional regulator n=1 Tax=Phytoactinopolyspora endophytica TaxID=1642495 RepID=UPI00101E04C4|nr:LacI family DNA-binding transcriptional regulator [Phytoactinopolyspora endophytica]